METDKVKHKVPLRLFLQKHAPEQRPRPRTTADVMAELYSRSPDKLLLRNHLCEAFQIPEDATDALLRGVPRLSQVLLRVSSREFEAFVLKRGLVLDELPEGGIALFDQEFLPGWLPERARLKTQCMAASTFLSSLALVDPDGYEYQKLVDDTKEA